MDRFTLDKLEFDRLRQILSRFCRCALGRSLAGRIGPSRRPETVRTWLEETSQMVRALREVGTPPFGGITDIRQALNRASPGGGASGEDFAAIAAALQGAEAVRRWAEGLPEPLELIRRLGGQVPDFREEVAQIRGVVDARGAVMTTASDTLARTRREIDSTRKRIHETIYGYVRRSEVARILQNPVVTLHEDRFVLPVKAEHRHELPGVVHRASHTGATLFVEPSESVELNNQLVELMQAERREIARLLNELAIQVARRGEEISSALRTLAQIDVIAAKAQYAMEFDCAAPEVSERGPLQLHQARHPLLIEQTHQQELAGCPPERRHPVVPIDVRLGVDFDVLIITGSNTGGKTVALKTVGLLAVMAQAGMHIPAQRGSSLPLFRDVLLDVGDEQSLQQSLSTFGAHIRRVRNILSRADRYSLVLLDELGAGTDPDEGGAIGQAVLDELRRLGCLAMVSTHLSVLKAYAINHERVDNASVEFDTRTLRPTYHLRIGEPGESHAITVAAAMGLPKQLTDAAWKRLKDTTGAFRRAIRATSASRRASEAARTEAHSARLAAETLQEQYAAKLADLQQLQQRFENWLASLAEMREGERLFVPRLNKAGRLARMEFNKQIALVDVDNVQVEVPLAELMPDLGQSGVRKEIASLREQILSQARQTEQFRQEADRLQSEYARALAQQRSRQQQYQQWLEEVGRAKVGDEVPIAQPPGRGKLVELDLLRSRARVLTPRGELSLPVQELFPQSGPFAVRRRPPGRAAGQKPPAQREPRQDRPMPRRSPDSKAAQASRQAVLATPPGQQVYVVPFHKRATLIRFNHEKDQAIVQSGAFEMQIPIADLEPARSGTDLKPVPPSPPATS